MTNYTNSYDLNIEEPKLDIQAILRFTRTILERVRNEPKDTQNFIKKCLENEN